MKKTILVLFASLVFFSSSNAQRSQRDSIEIFIPGLATYKNDRTMGKALQLVGTLALGTHFVLQNIYANRIADGELGAKPPPKALPIAGCAVMALGFTIDMGAIQNVLKKRRIKRQVKVSTENYDF